jgi:hypothetical protein
MPLVLAASLLAALPARALEVGETAPEDFISRSRTEPGRLYALIIGATWCHACHALSGGLAALAPSTSTAVGRAAWDLVETDEYGRAKFSKLMSELQAPQSDDLPSVLVIRNGDALGVSLAGNSIPKIEAFLAEAERQPPRYSRPAAKSSMLCPGRKDWASYTLGISGYKSAGDASTDDFGRKILLSFVPAEKSAPGRLFAPPRSKPAPGTEGARAEDGVFFSASDPLAGRATLLEDVARSTSALADLAEAPGRDVRLILTGHSGEEGMTVGYETKAWFKDDPTNTYESDVQLSLQDVAGAVSRASRAGKRVRGLITTCYAGRYADAFMPPAKPSAAPLSCAAFATLPDKTADGCYSNGLTLGVDYASKLIARRSCSSPQDGRALHYSVAVTTTGHDIPTLSSEYFLLYGPGASFLGRGDRAPAPPLSVQKYDLASDIRVYIDVISNQVLRAYQGERMIDPPRLALLDCVGDDFSHSKLDRENLSAFYLRPHKNGALVSECTPLVSLYWQADGGGERPSTTVFLDPNYSGWNPANDWIGGFRKDFDTTGPMITMQGMRPAARVLLTTVIPAFSDAGASDDLAGRLDRIVADLRPYDEPLAGALQAMMSAQAGGVQRGLPPDPAGVGKDAEAPGRKQEKPLESIAGFFAPPASRPGLDAPAALSVLPALLKAPSLSTAAWEWSSRAPTPAVEASALVAAMFGNLAPPKNEYDPPLSRLAHLAAAAQAELALIEEAKTSPEARRLFAQLEAIKTCEQGLY